MYARSRRSSSRAGAAAAENTLDADVACTPVYRTKALTRIGMAKNIVEKGSYSGQVAIYNRTTARAEKLVSSLPEGKAKVVKSIEDAVKEADIIFTCVSNDAAIEETIDAALKIPEAKDKLFVDCSTVHPDMTNNNAFTSRSPMSCPVSSRLSLTTVPHRAESAASLCGACKDKKSYRLLYSKDVFSPSCSVH